MRSMRTKMDGLRILREVVKRRRDGSHIVARDRGNEFPTLNFEQTIAADLGYTAEPSFSPRPTATRLIRCVDGEIYVVVADVRLGSRTFGKWQSFYLRQGDLRWLSVGAGLACGWQVTSASAKVEMHSNHGASSTAWRVLAWNDEQLEIDWPEHPECFARFVRKTRRLDGVPDRLLPKFKRNAANTKPGQAVSLRNQSPSKLTTKLPTKPALESAVPRILVIGSSGALGRDLCKAFRGLGTVLGACRNPLRQGVLPIPLEVDVSRPASIRQVIRRTKPTLIVNAASLTSVEQAEKEPRLAQLINATAPAIMAEEAQRRGASLVHFCTDMVYPSTGERPWKEADELETQSQYARTKLRGLRAIRSSGVPHLVLRSGWMYSPGSENFITQFIDQATYRTTLSLAEDHYGTPTSTAWLSQLTVDLLSRSKGAFSDWLVSNGGTFNAAPLGYASRIAVADQLLAYCTAHGVPTVVRSLLPKQHHTQPSSASAAGNCRLDCTKLALHFGIRLTAWQLELEQQLQAILDEVHCRQRAA